MPEPKDVAAGQDARDISKQDKITSANRAPTSKDVATIWIQYPASGDGNMTFWIRNPRSGTWKSAAFT